MSADNLQIYNALKEPPKEALKPITAGRLKGFTDINPMWRIKAMTQQFGPFGIGWGTCDEKYWTESANNEIAVFCSLHLWYRDTQTGEKSDPLFGIGGSKLLAQERNGLHLDDEAYKKAWTDAFGTACKLIGVASNIYFQGNSGSKYETREQELPKNTNVTQSTANPILCRDCSAVIMPTKTKTAQEVAKGTKAAYGRVLCIACAKAEKERIQASAL